MASRVAASRPTTSVAVHQIRTERRHGLCHHFVPTFLENAFAAAQPFARRARRRHHGYLVGIRSSDFLAARAAERVHFPSAMKIVSVAWARDELASESVP
jgi:hypothetical protein